MQEDSSRSESVLSKSGLRHYLCIICSRRFWALCAFATASFAAVAMSVPDLARSGSLADPFWSELAAGRETKTSEFLALFEQGDEDERWNVKNTSTIAVWGMLTVNQFLVPNPPMLAFCLPPPPYIVRADRVIELLQAEVKKTPAFGEEPIGAAIFAIMRKEFPCATG